MSSSSQPLQEKIVIASSTFEISSKHGGGLYPVEISKPFTEPQSRVYNALIICHGRKRNAVEYFQTGLKILEEAKEDPRKWIVIAPQYLNVSDLEAHKITEDRRFLAWDKDWQSGVAAHQGGTISSYGLLDDVLEKLHEKFVFPNLQHIVVVGHGGGAQMLIRYVIASRLPGITIPLHFVIANPGSYVFFGKSRPVSTPEIEAAVDIYDWKYGTEALVPYCEGEPALIERFAAKEVILLLGTKDTVTSGILDQSLPAQAQGKNRYERGKHFIQNVDAYGNSVGRMDFPLFSHQLVKGIGHNEMEMLTSREGLAAICKHVVTSKTLRNSLSTGGSYSAHGSSNSGASLSLSAAAAALEEEVALANMFPDPNVANRCATCVIA